MSGRARAIRLEMEIQRIARRLGYRPDFRPAWLVTSVIEPGAAPLSYTPIRSVFSPQERLAQTMETLHSIRRLSDAPIMLVEMSPFDGWAEVLDGIPSARAVHLAGCPRMADAAASAHKGLAEALVLAAACQAWPRSGFWKLSGRYTVDALPREGLHLDGGLVANHGPEVVSTVCLGVSPDACRPLGRWIRRQRRAMEAGIGIEQVITNFGTGSTLATPRRIPVSGLVAVDGTQFEIR